MADRPTTRARPWSTTAIAWLCGVAMLGACEPDEAASTQAPTVAPVTKAKPAADEKKDGAAVEAFTYSPVGKRDPFRSYLADLAAELAQQEKPHKVSPTEEFALDQYRLTGVITGTSQPKAMVEDPKGQGHVLQIGTRLGRNGGRITQITSSSVVVVEETRTPTGERLRVPITLRLPKEELDVLVQ